MSATPLKDRQLEVLALFASGKSFEEIGQETFLAYQTVRYHIHQARTTVGARSLPHLVAIAVNEGWISMNGERVCELPLAKSA